MTLQIDLDNWSKRIPRQPLVVRDQYILDNCRDKHVVHLGATDSPFTQEKGVKGELIHQKLQSICRSVAGYDHDRKSIEWMAQQLDLRDVVHKDLSDVDQSLKPVGDVVLCGDIIEHVNNVGNLLHNCNLLCRPQGQLLLSTINALSIKQLMRIMVGREAVHPDHVAYYSLSTLGVMMRRFGFELIDCRFFKYPIVRFISGVVFDTMYTLAPQCADGIIVRAEKNRDV